MKIIAVIPARYASTRFPAKLMQDLGGKTVIQNPCAAIAPAMPRAALKIAKPEIRLKLEDIADKLIELACQK